MMARDMGLELILEILRDRIITESIKKSDNLNQNNKNKEGKLTPELNDERLRYDNIKEQKKNNQQKYIYKVGDAVEIISGIFEGVKGEIINFSWGNFRIRVDELNIINIPENDVKIIENAKQREINLLTEEIKELKNAKNNIINKYRDSIDNLNEEIKFKQDKLNQIQKV